MKRFHWTKSWSLSWSLTRFRWPSLRLDKRAGTKQHERNRNRMNERSRQYRSSGNKKERERERSFERVTFDDPTRWLDQRNRYCVRHRVRAFHLGVESHGSEKPTMKERRRKRRGSKKEERRGGGGEVAFIREGIHCELGLLSTGAVDECNAQGPVYAFHERSHQKTRSGIRSPPPSPLNPLSLLHVHYSTRW